MLVNKVALITGGANGIGLAVARALLARQAKVCLADINQDAGMRALEELSKQHGTDKVTFVTCDATDREQVADAMENAERKLGKLDIVCNNAGSLDKPDWRKCVDLNLTSVIEGTYQAVELMKGRGGSIINTASMAGIYPVPYAPVYSATKSAVVAFTRAMAPLKDTEGIRVNCVCPYFTDTELVHSGTRISKELARHIGDVPLLKVDDIAQGFLKLLADENVAGEALCMTPFKEPFFAKFPQPK
eukprot:comp21661_c0_seq1/m.30464 comp21661_c0_seq1/g.30464  ORF comp21661_c0_seq1/g.30464 comp21661_c0_seq1/m.30464 type:complete len:245 (-) comp21661_c0_seq1:589-1323(-)